MPRPPRTVEPAPAAAALPAIAIVGNDVLLAVRPATAVQLAHALQRIGFDIVVPASWGDELVAYAALQNCTERGTAPAVLCACPHVARRLLGRGDDLQPFLVALVSPPVAVARYLRQLYAPAAPRLTYLGGCPSGTAPELDARLTTDELRERLAQGGIVVDEMPTVFESVLPPDRRRTVSLPGGAPSAEAVRHACPTRRFLELDGPDYAEELAQHLLSGESVLLDIAPRVGCACSGAVANVPPEAARGTVTSLEPPRSRTSVVDLAVAPDLSAPLPAVMPEPAPPPPPVAGPPRAGPAAPAEPREATRGSRGEATPEKWPGRTREPRPPAPAPRVPLGPGRPEPRSGGRLRSPALGVPRFTGATPPVSRTGEGKPLPRAYVAHRRPSGPRRVVDPELAATLDHATPPVGSPVAVPRGAEAAEPRAERERPLQPVVEPTRVVRTLEAERAARDGGEELVIAPRPTPPSGVSWVEETPPDESPAEPAGVDAAPAPAEVPAARPSLAAAFVATVGATPTPVPPPRAGWRLPPSERARAVVVTALISAALLMTVALLARRGDSRASAPAAADSLPRATAPTPETTAATARPGARSARIHGESAGTLVSPRPGSARTTQRRPVPRVAAPRTQPPRDTAPSAATPPAVTTQAPVSAPPPVAAPVASPSLATPAARADSSDAEAALRREIQRRRARLDSINRVLESLGTRKKP